jgi:hypothetical protein
MLRAVIAVRRAGGAAVALLLLGAAPAAAHSVAGTYDYPLPQWLWLLGACAAVVVTFAIALRRSPPLAAEEPRPAGPRHPALARAMRVLVPIGEAVSVLVMAVAILSCLIGSEDPNHSFGAVYFWVVWWVSLGIFAVLVTDLYAWLSPWGVVVRRVLAPLAGDPDAVGRIPYPARLGRWPAAAALVAFAWIELVYEPAREPRTLGLLLLAYSVAAVVVPLVIGIDAWQRCVDPFGVLSATLSRAAPIELRALPPEPCEACAIAEHEPSPLRIDCASCYRRAAPDRRDVRLRLPGLGVLRGGTLGPGGAAFVVAALGSVVFDGFSQTVRWKFDIVARIAEEYPSLNPSSSRVLDTLGLLLVTGLLGLLLVVCARWLPGGPARFAAALIPIAGVYFIAHYAAYLLVIGQRAIELAADPFDRGWVLFHYQPVEILTPAMVWYGQVALIVYGHAVAVLAAHRLGRERGEARSVAGELPAALLAVAYTFLGLWVLAQQIAPD